MTIHLIVTSLIIISTMILYMFEKIPMEISSAFAIISFLFLFHFYPILDENNVSLITEVDLIAGFAHPALLTVLSLLIIGQALYNTGALNYVVRGLFSSNIKNPITIIIIVFLCAFIISGVMNNTPVVIMLIPVFIAIANNYKLSASRLLMPLSFICIFGGMTTIIGSSTNLIAASVFYDVTNVKINFFDLTIPALFLSFVGITYIVIISPFLLPKRKEEEDAATIGQNRLYLSKIEIFVESPLHGAKSIAGFFPDLKNITISMIERGDKKLYPPFDITLRSGDILTVIASRHTLEEIFRLHYAHLPGDIHDQVEKSNDELRTIEAVIPPTSSVLSRSIEQIDFSHETKCAIIGIQRHGRMLRIPMRNVKLRPGDIILIIGHRSNLKELRNRKDFLLLELTTQTLPNTKKVLISACIFLLTLVLMSTGILPPLLASLIGAILMILSGSISARMVKRVIDTRIIMVIGSSLAMGKALFATGGVEQISNFVVDHASDYGPVILITASFALSAILTNFLSNNATVILLTPIAIQAANSLSIDPFIMTITIILGANCSFMTPISYQTNLLVMSPGNYKFRDFIFFGTPLVILLVIAYYFFVKFYFLGQF